MRSSLVVFEQQHLVGEEEQEEGEEGHGHQDGDHPREGHGDEEGGHEVGVSLSNGVGLITMELNDSSLVSQEVVLEQHLVSQHFLKHLKMQAKLASMTEKAILKIMVSMMMAPI